MKCLTENNISIGYEQAKIKHVKNVQFVKKIIFQYEGEEKSGYYMKFAELGNYYKNEEEDIYYLYPDNFYFVI